MAGSARAELASSGLDGSAFAPPYPNGHRGTYSAANLERSGSFRESLESRLMGSGQMPAARNVGALPEIPPVTQYMTLETFSTNELKNVRPGELRRVLGISVEDHSFGSLQAKPLPPVSWDELKRFRGSVDEVNSKAKERVKLLQDSLVKLDKVRNALSKKRQRNDSQSFEKSSNSNLLKIGSQIHQYPTDLVGQRPEERTKTGAPNKRVRSSMAEASLPYPLLPEGRNTLPMRQGTMVDKDKSIPIDREKTMLRACNGVSLSTDDKMRGLPTGGEGWDKKMKRKRSVGTMVSRTLPDGDREVKQAIQQRPINELRQRAGDGIGCRTASSNGINGKMDGIPQVNGSNSRSIPKNDLVNGSFLNDRRERSIGLDKERITSKGSNKLNICEDTQLGNQSPSTKGKAARIPRSSSSVLINTSSFSRSSGGVEGLEQPSCSNNIQPLAGANSRKRSLASGSTSPTVARWGGQRREKTSRTRRVNVVSPVSNFDEAQAEGSAVPDGGARSSSMESCGLSFSRGLPNNTHLKLKLENSSPPMPSESEESSALENKSKEKGIDDGDVEDGGLNAANKTGTFVLPTKKNKVPLKEEICDGVRRQGRSGRGSIQSRTCLQSNKEKLGSAETTRPLKSGRLIGDKSERIGRSLPKKVSDRKSSTRPVQIIDSGSTELAGESDDDHEELLAAANYVWNVNRLTPFWKEMEPIFGLITSEDLALLKLQINFAEELDGSFGYMLDADYRDERPYEMVPHSYEQAVQTDLVGLKKCSGAMCSVDVPQPGKAESKTIERERWPERVIPLSQRLLSAFIPEEGTDTIDNNARPRETYLQFSSHSPYCTDNCAENEHGSDQTSPYCAENERGSNQTKYSLQFDNDLGSQTNYFADGLRCNGFASPSTTFRSPSNFISSDELLQENDNVVNPGSPDAGALSKIGQDKSNQQFRSTGLSGTDLSLCQFEQMSLDDKILMELHSIGIYPDMPDIAEGGHDEIDKAVSELKTSLYQQVRKKKSQLCKLEKVIHESRACDMRKLEQVAMNKLVEMAFEKLLGGRGSSHKCGASKVSKKLALAFAKRTLMRCRKFVETGQSCFREPILRDVLFSEPVHNNAGKISGSMSSGIAPIMHVESHNFLLGSRESASVLSSNIIERHGSVNISDRSQLDAYSEQTLIRNDPIFNKGRKKEVLLDEFTGGASRASPTVNTTLQGGAKWKKTDKDHNRDTLAKNSSSKEGRPSLSTGRGERRTKSKPKQKIAELSNSGNGLGRVTETSNMSPSLETINTGSSKVKHEVELASSHNTQNLPREMEDSIFTNLPLQGIDSIDELDVADGLGGQGQDIGSWLNFDDDALQDNDLVGLEIPMDDLSELTLNF